MQFIKNGPDIPERLLQAHEEGKVVFFCGAGISYPAGLPGFDGLVDDLYRELGIGPTAVEDVSRKRGQYDTTIGLLEGRILGGRGSVRAQLGKILKPKLRRKHATRTHEALLTLAKCRKGPIRLVTTNFDRVFETLIAKQGDHIPTFEAPLLPVPKSRWSGLVYLHGLLRKVPTDEHLNRLVMSSGDFGLAYLTERWAARFVSELFRTYTVCFVGYSINDPVLRYMMDALAADRLMGEAPAESFAFGSYSDTGEEAAADEWRAKNVTPILYEGTKGHPYLHETLHAWAETYRDGVQGKEAVVARYAAVLPTGVTKQDDFVRRMLWAICDKSGLPAKRFAEFDPLPSFAWLEPLSHLQYGHDDLSRFGVASDTEADRSLSFSVLARPTPYRHAPWMTLFHDTRWSAARYDLVMNHLAHWLARHWTNPQLLLWIAKYGGALHPAFANALTDEFRAAKASPMTAVMKTMTKLWGLAFANRLKSLSDGDSLYAWIERFRRDGFSAGIRLSLREALAPCVVLSERIHLPQEDEKDETAPAGASRLFQWEIDLRTNFARSVLADVREGRDWAEILPVVHHDFVALLEDALDLMRELEGAGDRHDYSYIHRPSIGDHPQNSHFEEWTLLIELARDSWISLAAVSPVAAADEVRRWLNIPYPVFRRLAYYAAVVRPDIINPSQALDWLLADERWWLWSVETRREALQLVTSLAEGLTEPDIHRLQASILLGPPANMFNEKGDAGRLQKMIERHIWLLLKKLEAAGAKLVPEATTRLAGIEISNPEWRLADGDRDDFPVWSDNGAEWRTLSSTPNELNELKDWLVSHPSDDEFFEADDWSERCVKDKTLASEALISLARSGDWPIGRWRQALQAWSNDDDVKWSWRTIGPVLGEVPTSDLKELAWSIAWWLDSVAKVLDDEPSMFVGLVNRILSAYANDKLDLLDNPQHRAINHPVGLVTQAIVRSWFRRDLEDGQKLARDIEDVFTEICSKRRPGLHYGRMILARNVIPLYRVDRQWTAKNLLPYFEWKETIDFPRTMWEGFLQSPRLYWPLLDNLKRPFLETARHYEALEEIYGHQYASFLCYAALEPNGSFTSDDFARAFSDLPNRAFEHCAQVLLQAFESAVEQRAEYLRNRLAPFMKKYWPKSSEARTPAISGIFARICAAAGSVFPLALAQFKDWLQPTQHSGSVLRQLPSICAEFPAEALTFVDLIVGNDAGARIIGLKQCLLEIRAGRPKLEQDTRFQRLVTLVRQVGEDWPEDRLRVG